MKNKLARIMMLFVAGVMLMGLIVYEAYSITKKEYARQENIVNEAREQAEFNLNMIKIAVQTNDAESYAGKVESIKAEREKMGGMFMVQEEWAEYMTLLDEYMEVLDGKEVEIVEMGDLKAEVVEVAKVMKEKYGNKDKISRDKVKAAKDEILQLKIDASKYQVASVVAMANAVNEILDGIVGKVSALADCVDTCYKNRINEINDELAEKLKDFGNKAKDLNSDFEKEFEFGKMDAIKTWGKVEVESGVEMDAQQ